MISRAAIDLILEFEGLDQPSRWPGGASGITIGHGYDLGYTPAAELVRDWSSHLAPAVIDRLVDAIGIRGTRARAIAGRFSDIRITPAAAREVFTRATLPKWERLTRETFPGSDSLPPDAFGALVSLTFNRGTSMSGDRRREMREIRDIIRDYIADPDPASLPRVLSCIANEIRHMKRLWTSQNLPGLLRRRDAEATLIEHSALCPSAHPRAAHISV